MALITVICNILVMVTLFKLKYYKSSHHFLLIMLAITDTASGLVSQPLISYEFYLRRMEDRTMLCIIGKFNLCIAYFLTGLSMSTLFLITFEMFKSLINPFHGRYKTSFYVKTLTGLWTFFALYCALGIYAVPETYIHVFKTVSAILILLTFVTLCFLLGRILREAGRMLNRENGPKSQLLTNAAKLTKSILIAFGVCYSPNVLLNAYILIFGKSSFTVVYLIPAANVIVLSNALVNPFVYCFRLKAIRVKMFRILYGGFRGTEKRENTVTAHHSEFAVVNLSVI
ncbi:probable glycoprotein hormone G-protein coupled receptor [Clytia hemisphaerica]|uniref:probable glycoprotein hormone G-protein coupled receptor n=1 Tax=Clytia hemisphaerica TaxID=252671 RepID=UPI0034D51DE9